MTALPGLAMEAAGGALLAAAVLQLRYSARAANGALTSIARGRRKWMRGLADRYDSSPGGRRLGARLDAASIRVRPGRWRATQVGLMLPGTALGGLAFGSLLMGLSTATMSVRMGSWALLRTRRERRDDELTDAAATLARHLATELSSGSTPTEACASLAGTEDTRARPRLDGLLAATGARVALGESVVLALHRTVGELPAGRGRDTLGLLATELELVVERGCGTGVLTRLASGIDERRQTVAEVRAATAEVRMATLAVPMMGLVVAGLLLLADPPMAAAALGPVGAGIGVALGGVAACATALARRVTSAGEPA